MEQLWVSASELYQPIHKYSRTFMLLVGAFILIKQIDRMSLKEIYKQDAIFVTQDEYANYYLPPWRFPVQ